jgi:hypothetical protein
MAACSPPLQRKNQQRVGHNPKNYKKQSENESNMLQDGRVGERLIGGK